jgi:hypothetical protein
MAVAQAAIARPQNELGPAAHIADFVNKKS